MARRYGGKFSPGAAKAEGAPALERPRRRRAGLRANLMFVPPAILLLRATLIVDDVTTSLVEVTAAAVLFLAAWLNREGLIAQDAYDSRVSARRPAIPRKIFAAVLSGIAIAILRGFGDELGAGLFFGVIAGGLHLAAFGTDPLRDKRPEGVDDHQSERVQRIVDDAENSLAEMRARIAPLRERALTERVETFAATVRTLAAQVAADPRDLAGARRFLGVYLRGARDATARFADLYARSGDADARASWEALMDEMRTGLEQRTQKRRLDDRSGLDIEIDVLRDRLRREGVAIPREETEGTTS